MRFKQMIYTAFCGMLIWVILPVDVYGATKKASYETKDEVIYGKLHGNGQVKDMYIVNSFHETTKGNIKDYGPYENIRNLTDLSIIEQTDDEVIFESTGEDFYYQGELKKQKLPWVINISYYLDGVKVDADELAGESGNLEIHIETKANKEVDPVFFDYYLLQISLTFDPLHFHDITAPKGTEANEGKNKLINFSALPGEENIFITTARVENLTMEPISISAIPANLAFEDPDLNDMEDDMKKLSDAIKELHEGVIELYDGISEINDGTGTLNDGSSEFLKGMKTLNNSSQDLIDGSKQIKDAFSEINDALDVDINIELPSADDLKELAEIIREMGQELAKFSEVFKEVDELLREMAADDLDESDYAKVYTVLENYGADKDVREIVDQLVATHAAVKGLSMINEQLPIDLENVAIEMSQYLTETADELENNLHLLDELDEITKLVDVLKTMATEYRQFHEGLVAYTEGINELTIAYGDIDSGIHELSEGTATLKNGIKDLVDGTKELHDATSDLPDEIESELEQFMADFDFSDFKPKSFVSKKNKKIGVVQFVLQTESIELPEDDTEDEVEEESKNLWQKFLDLFR